MVRRVWNTKDGRLVRTLKAHRAGVRGLVASAAGNRLYSCSADNTIQVRALTHVPHFPSHQSCPL